MAPGVPPPSESSAAVPLRLDGGTGASISICSSCKSDDRWILHNLHTNRTFRLLCTSCVLKIHRSAFCPICFSLHPRKSQSLAHPPPAGCLLCFKCGSATHSDCVASNTPKSPYLCPSCLNPALKLFDFSKKKPNQSIDLKSAKALRAAAMIAANTLHEAADRAREVAEKKAKEAIDARRKSKEELDKLGRLWIQAMREGNTEVARMAVINHNGFLGFKTKSSGVAPLQVVEKKEGFSNGGIVDRKEVTTVVNKVINGGSQLLQNNK